MSFTSWFRNASISRAEVRAEIWRLGARSRGWPLEGALAELKTRNVPLRRAVLLRLCIRTLRCP
jgi:hypothetical protein